VLLLEASASCARRGVTDVLIVGERGPEGAASPGSGDSPAVGDWSPSIAIGNETLLLKPMI